MNNGIEIIESDELLIASIKEGNLAVLGLLYDKYASVLYGLISKIIGDDELSEAALQETFLLIRSEINTYNSSKIKLINWMLNIARDTAIKVIKTEQFKEISQNRAIDNLVSILDKGEDRIELSLEEKILDLIYLKGMKYAEVAVSLNLPVESVIKTIRMAIKNQREKIEL